MSQYFLQILQSVKRKILSCCRLPEYDIIVTFKNDKGHIVTEELYIQDKDIFPNFRRLVYDEMKLFIPDVSENDLEQMIFYIIDNISGKPRRVYYDVGKYRDCRYVLLNEGKVLEISPNRYKIIQYDPRYIRCIILNTKDRVAPDIDLHAGPEKIWKAFNFLQLEDEEDKIILLSFVISSFINLKPMLLVVTGNKANDAAQILGHWINMNLKHPLHVTQMSNVLALGSIENDRSHRSRCWICRQSTNSVNAPSFFINSTYELYVEYDYIDHWEDDKTHYKVPNRAIVIAIQDKVELDEGYLQKFPVFKIDSANIDGFLRNSKKILGATVNLISKGLAYCRESELEIFSSPKRNGKLLKFLSPGLNVIAETFNMKEQTKKSWYKLVLRNLKYHDQELFPVFYCLFRLIDKDFEFDIYDDHEKYVLNLFRKKYLKEEINLNKMKELTNELLEEFGLNKHKENESQFIKKLKKAINILKFYYQERIVVRKDGRIKFRL